MDMQGILVVCKANICRSPLIALRLQQRLPDAIRVPSLLVNSVGTDAVGDSAICDVVLRHLADSSDKERAALHSSRRLDRTAVVAAQLILTAETRERAQVSRLDPNARARTFTLLEAVQLSGLEPRSEESRLLDECVSADLRLTVIAQILHSRRGLVNSPARPILDKLFSRDRLHEPDLRINVADAHQSGRTRHRAVINEIESATKRLTANLEKLCGSKLATDPSAPGEVRAPEFVDPPESDEQGDEDAVDHLNCLVPSGPK